ncbi:MAG: hypothetical protein NTW86_24025, partial [Candidatus Sumerlaeota bacterium]|nr:hypothetical protein [Candidatus Sumerlaeota bacterium]
EAAHNALRQNDRAWVLAQQTLACLLRLRDQNAGRFDFGVLTPIRAENGAELEELNTFLRGRFRCRQRFDLASGAGALAAEEIGRALRRIHRRSGLSDHLDYVALRRALRPRRADVARSDDPAAGRSLAFVFNDGSLSFCLCVQPFANLRDFSMDFTRAWTSPQAEAARRESHAHACADPFCLAKAVAHTFAGLLAMLRELW